MTDDNKKAHLKKQREMEETAAIHSALEREAMRAYQITPLISPENEPDDKTSLDNDVQNIIKAYKKQFPGRIEEDEDKRPLLRFKSEKEAEAFFSDMAKQNCKFLAIQVSQGQSTGAIFLSLGDGQLHQALLNPEDVNQFCDTFQQWAKESDPKKKEALKDDLLQQMNPKMQNTGIVELDDQQQFKEKLRAIRPDQRNDEDDLSPASSRFNPFRTQPKPTN